MKLTTVALSAMAVAAASVSAHPMAARAIDPALIPDLGPSNSSGPCPPSRAAFIEALTANVAAGHVLTNPAVAITFPTDPAPASQRARLDATAATLLNFFGPADGCPLPAQLQGPAHVPRARVPSRPAKTAAPAKPAKPAKSTARPVKTKAAPPALRTSVPPKSVRPARPAAKSVAGPPGKTKAAPPALRTSVPPRTGGKLRLPGLSVFERRAGAVDARLVPDFGVARGARPDGFGNCKGVNNVNIPCACPPPRAEFLSALNANVAAGHAVKNPGVKVAFPTGSSKADQQARIGALLVTLQNMHGPGVGCPAVSTVYGQLQQKINALPN
ncbi:hypothetical protein VTO73DRAFT_8879 [Trametes versicolor]